MRTSVSRRRSVSSLILRRIRGRAIALLPTTRRATRRRRPPPGALLSTSVGPVVRRPTATPARAGSHPTLLLPRHAGNSSRSIRQNASPSRRRSRTTNRGRSSSRRRGTRETPQRCCLKRSHPQSLQMLQGKRSQTGSKRTWQAPS